MLVLALGLHGALLLAVPCLLVAAVLPSDCAATCSASCPIARRKQRSPERTTSGRWCLLLIVITFRSLAWYGVLTFVPLWEVSLGHSKSYGTALLWSMLLIGGIGTLARRADRRSDRAAHGAARRQRGDLPDDARLRSGRGCGWGGRAGGRRDRP